MHAAALKTTGSYSFFASLSHFSTQSEVGAAVVAVA